MIEMGNCCVCNLPVCLGPMSARYTSVYCEYHDPEMATGSARPKLDRIAAFLFDSDKRADFMSDPKDYKIVRLIQGDRPMPPPVKKSHSSWGYRGGSIYIGGFRKAS